MKINKFTPDTQIFKDVSNTKTTNKVNDKFANFLESKLNDVNEAQIDAENTTQDFIKGKEKDIHNVMLKTQEAKMSLEMAVEIRNKIVDAYNELSRMQL